MKRDIDKVKEFLQKKAKYKIEAYHFVLQSLRFLMKKMPKRGHVSGKELSNAIKDYANDQYGFLAPTVFGSWGVKETLDFGHIVFDLVELEILRKTETDSLEDFKNVYAFDTVFRQGFLSSVEKF